MRNKTVNGGIMQGRKTIEKMGVDEVTALAEQVQEQEEILDNVDQLGSDYLQDKDRLVQAVAKGKRILERDAQLVPQTGAQKDAVRKEIMRLQELIVKEMPTTTEMNYQLGTVESEQAVRKNRMFQQKWTPTLLRLKDLKRRLEPDDPLAGNLERIRPK
jgi:hypothetical protein